MKETDRPGLVILTGPTAVGKSELSIMLAEQIGGEIISADSMQIYRRMDIGTAKPTPEEMQGIPHHMIDVADPEEDFSVARYVDMAARRVEDVLARGKLPILAGGTGLYIDSLLSGRTFAAFDENSPLRAEVEGRYAREGGEVLLRELAQADPDTATRLHPNDGKRIVRALEVWLTTGNTITRHNEETRALPPRYSALTLTLDFARRDLTALPDPDGAFDAVIAANLKGAFLCMKAVSRLMLKQRYGRVVNLSSVVGLRGNAGQVNYAASKAGVIGMTKSLAKELASRGVTVNAVAPGFIETDMTAALPEAARTAAQGSIPMNRLGGPEDVAKAAAFLASDDAAYITGQVLAVDGGMAM